MAESPSLRLVPGVCRSKRLAIDERDFIGSKERMVNTREEVEATLNELEVFREARGVGLLVEHEASEGLDEDLAGTKRCTPRSGGDNQCPSWIRTTFGDARDTNPERSRHEGTGSANVPSVRCISPCCTHVWAQSDFRQASRPPGWAQ